MTSSRHGSTQGNEQPQPAHRGIKCRQEHPNSAVDKAVAAAAEGEFIQ